MPLRGGASFVDNEDFSPLGLETKSGDLTNSFD